MFVVRLIITEILINLSYKTTKFIIIDQFSISVRLTLNIKF